MKSLGRCFVTLAFLVPALAGCDKKTTIVGPSVAGKGTILVTVVDHDGNVVRSATVITNPTIGVGSKTTDGLGQVLLRDVSPGLYTVAATRTPFGSARDAAQVEANQLYRVNLKLEPGVFLEPQVRILQPVYPATYSYVDSLILLGSVTDIEDPPDSLALTWRSSVEGLLSTAHADANGLTEVRHGPVPVGTRWIVLRAVNSTGLVGADSVQVTVRSFPPQLSLSRPTYGAGFMPGDPIAFEATVSDRETPNAALVVEWRSSLDGVLHQGPPAAKGVSSFTSTTLSRGLHSITVSVTDGDGNQTRDSVSVHNDLPQSVVLQPITPAANGLVLHWTRVSEPDFVAYRIYRSTSSVGPYALIAELPDSTALQYSDGTATLGVTYWYRIGLLTTTGAESHSNTQSGVAGVYINVGRSIARMILDPNRPYIYALDSSNNALLFIDRDSLKVKKSIFIGSNPSDLDIDKAGNELFVANFGAAEIAVVDLTTQTRSRTLIVDTGGIWEGNPYRLACMTAGRLAWTSLDQWNSMKLIDTQTGVRLTDTGSIYQPELVSSPDGARVYAAESGISGSNVYRYEVVGGQLQQTDLTPGYGYPYSSRLVKVSGDGSYLFFATKKLDAGHLATELGTFSEQIHACSHDGSLVVGSSHVFDGNTFAILRTLPISGTLMALASDDRTLYSFDPGTNRIYVLDVSGTSVSSHATTRIRSSSVRAALGARRQLRHEGR